MGDNLDDQDLLFVEKLSPLFVSLIATVVSILFNGYVFGKNDQVLQIPLAQSYQNSSLYPHDPLFAQGEYKSFFWEFLSFLDIYLTLWIVVFVIYFLSMSLYYYFAFLIGERLTHARSGGFILVLLLLTPKPGLGFAIMSHDIWLSLRVVTGPLLLFSFYLYLQNRIIVSFVVLGISLNLHPISALQMIFILTLHYLLTHRNYLSQIILNLIKSIIGFIIAGLPIFLVVFTNRVKNKSQSDASIIGAPDHWLRIMRIRNGHMVFPSEFSVATIYSNLVIYIIISIIILRRMDSTNKKFFINLFIPVLILFFVNLIFSEIIPSVFIIQLQFGRVLRLFSLFVMMLLTIDVHRILKKQLTDIADLSILLTFLAMVFSTYYQISMLLVLGIYTSVKLLNKEFTLTNLANTLRHKIVKRKKKNITLLLILLIYALSPFFAGNYLQNDTVYPEYEVRLDPDDSWNEIQSWVFTYISANDIFITPPHLEGFRVGSQKPIVGEWKDGTLGFFNTSYLDDWWNRMLDFGYTESNYNQYSDETYNLLSFDLIIQKYQAKYLVGFIGDSVSYERYGDMIYSNSKYLLIELIPLN